MGHFGFSYVGFIYLLMLFIPNAIWAKSIPADYDTAQENKTLLLFERVGQVCCTASALLFTDFNLAPFSAWSIWLIASFALMLLYEVCWVRYFAGERSVKSFYRSFCGVPVPLAVLPVAAFLLLGVYGRVIWLVVSAVILGIGHIGIHIQHVKRLT